MKIFSDSDLIPENLLRTLLTEEKTHYSHQAWNPLQFRSAGSPFWQGEQYFGKLHQNVPHGRGKLVYYYPKQKADIELKIPDWAIFEGEFSRGVPSEVNYTDSWGSKLHGLFDGCLRFVKGSGCQVVTSNKEEIATYTGLWDDSKCTGTFSFKSSPNARSGIKDYQGDIMAGTWPIGNCSWTDCNGTVYDGSISVDEDGHKMFRGKSERTVDERGHKFQITYLGDLPLSEGTLGKGTMTFVRCATGEEVVYEGWFDSNSTIHRGRRADPKADFEGEFHKGKRKWGRATYNENHPNWKNCVYEGEWSLDLWHGKGQLIYNDGHIYIGQFHSGEPKGHGLVASLIGFPTLPSPFGKIKLSYGEWHGKQLLKSLDAPTGYIEIRLGKGVVLGIKSDGEQHEMGIVNEGDAEPLSIVEKLLLSQLPKFRMG